MLDSSNFPKRLAFLHEDCICHDNQKANVREVRKVGAWLKEPVSTTGMAASKVCNLSHLPIAINRSSDQQTINVSYYEIVNSGKKFLIISLIEWWEIEG